MLKDILKILYEGGYLSRSRLATRLNVNQEIIGDAIDQLLRMRYLLEEKTGENCAAACTNCPFAKNCSKEIIKTFKLSDKGIKYLKQDSAANEKDTP